jgi:hypothetical protein
MMTRFDARIGSYYGHDPNGLSTYDREFVTDGKISVMADYYQGWQRVLRLAASSG